MPFLLADNPTVDQLSPVPFATIEPQALVGAYELGVGVGAGLVGQAGVEGTATLRVEVLGLALGNLPVRGARVGGGLGADLMLPVIHAGPRVRFGPDVGLWAYRYLPNGYEAGLTAIKIGVVVVAGPHDGSAARWEGGLSLMEGPYVECDCGGGAIELHLLHRWPSGLIVGGELGFPDADVRVGWEWGRSGS